MLRYVIRRTGAAIMTLIAASIVIFAFIHLIPGDPVYVMLGDGATPDQVAALRARLGLDEPVVLQYLIWAGNALQGDLGHSVFFETPVTQVIADGAETSILLATMTMVWIVGFGIPVGVLAAMRQGRWVDQGLSGLAMLLASVPTFWVGLYLILIFAAGLGWFPSSGYPSIFEEGGLANLRYLVLPSIALAAPNAALILRLTRASMLDVAREDYVRTARAKGISPTRVVVRHILRNALLAVVSAFGFTFAALISEAVVTETVFALPGVGRTVVQSILRRDYPVIQGVILIIVCLYLVINLLVDLSYRMLDPRVELE
ncbi:ABC transporter permease [Szabonella alba]|nr:ABC transporter permease [Szabonella alba]